LGRAEGFAMSNPVFPSMIDGMFNSMGYSWILLTVATFREILGSGTWFGLTIIPHSFYEAGYQNMGIMVLAPGAFFVLGLLIWAQNALVLRNKGKS
jgi:Na+-transporting NADH:ubiquinone oxidoreductase subunit D